MTASHLCIALLVRLLRSSPSADFLMWDVLARCGYSKMTGLRTPSLHGLAPGMSAGLEISCSEAATDCGRR